MNSLRSTFRNVISAISLLIGIGMSASCSSSSEVIRDMEAVYSQYGDDLTEQEEAERREEQLAVLRQYFFERKPSG